MEFPPGDERDPRVLFGRLIERIDQTNQRIGEWQDHNHDRFERGANEMAALRAEIAELRGQHHKPPPLPTEGKTETPKGLLAGVTDLLKSGKEFLEAVASLKELAIAIAIIVAAVSVASHPETFKALIDTYSASGHEGRE